MIKTKEELSLNEMLEYVGLPCLPEPNDEEQTWVRAIVHIERKTGIKDYVVATHDLFSWKEIRIKKESGGTGITNDVLGIYPYEYLIDRYFPSVSTKKDIIDYLISRCNEDKTHLNSMSKGALKKLFMNICIKEQLTSPTVGKSYSYSTPIKGVFANNDSTDDEQQESEKEVELNKAENEQQGNGKEQPGESEN